MKNKFEFYLDIVTDDIVNLKIDLEKILEEI